MVKELYASLLTVNLSRDKLWVAFSIRQLEKVREKSVIKQLTDIISLVRFQLVQITKLNMFSSEVMRRFQSWMFEKLRKLSNLLRSKWADFVCSVTISPHQCLSRQNILIYHRLTEGADLGSFMNYSETDIKAYLMK